jgi:hypothetical protein
LTPREISVRIKGANKRLIREHNDRALLAYNIATLNRVEAKKFPKLDKLMYREPKQRRQNWQEQLQIAKTWTQIYDMKQKQKTKAK